MKQKKKKKAKRKVTKKKKKVKRRKSKAVVVQRGLHAKKLKIMAAVPVMPCSAIDKDIHGLRYAYTQATQVYQRYTRLCREKGLTTRRIEGMTTDAHYGDSCQDSDGKTKFVKRPCVRFEGVWEIRDKDTGETETFGGSGDGDNLIWSANSAQTIAKKQALLDYFETAWPQPTNHLKIIRESFEQIPPEEKVKAFEQVLPKEAWNIMSKAGAIKALREFYGGVKCQKQQHKSKESK